MFFIGNRTDVVEFVVDILLDSNIDWRLTTIIPHGKSEDFCVFFAIDTSLEDTVETKAQTYSLQRIPTWPPKVPGGSYR